MERSGGFEPSIAHNGRVPIGPEKSGRIAVSGSAQQRDRRSQEGHRRAVSHIFPTWASRYAQTVPRGPRMSVLLSQPAVAQERVALETNSNGAAPSPMIVCQGSGSVVIPPLRPAR